MQRPYSGWAEFKETGRVQSNVSCEVEHFEDDDGETHNVRLTFDLDLVEVAIDYDPTDAEGIACSVLDAAASAKAAEPEWAKDLRDTREVGGFDYLATLEADLLQLQEDGANMQEVAHVLEDYASRARTGQIDEERESR